MNIKKFDKELTSEDITTSLSGFKVGEAYILTRKDNEEKFKQVLSFISATGYTSKTEIQSVNLIYSASANTYNVSMLVGRMDRNKGNECYDMDLFYLAPSGSADSYFLNQEHHTKGTDGNRLSFPIAPYKVVDEKDRKDLLYSTFLTGSLTSCSFKIYQSNQEEFFEVHKRCFE